MTQLHQLSATQQLEAMRVGNLSPVELTEHYLARIARFNDELGAYVTVTAGLAREEAEAAEERYLRDPPATWPALLGLPIPIKDLHATAGVETASGTAALRPIIPTADAWTVGLIRSAGAVLTGKSNTSEFGLTCYTENAGGLTAVTPFDTNRYSSGSSGGAATAVSAGLAPVAHGSDGAGSVRTPASATGLVGYKPSRGACSSLPALAWMAVSTEGPLARTVADAALLADAMCTPSPADLWPDVRGPADRCLREAAHRAETQRLRIGIWTDTGMPDVPAHPAAVAAIDALTHTLDRLGHDVQMTESPWQYGPAFLKAMTTRFASGTRAAIENVIPVERHHLLRPFTRSQLKHAQHLSAMDVIAAGTWLAEFASTMNQRSADYDVWICPTTSGPAPSLGWFEAEGLDCVTQRMLAWSCGTPVANLTGQCAISLPLARNDEELPIGIQLSMKAGRDGELFGLSAQLEQAHPWVHHQPVHMKT